jgi:phosphatidylserine decarboxylase
VAVNDKHTSSSAKHCSLDKLLTFPQYLLPQHTLSKLMFRLTRSETKWFKNAFIRFIVKNYRVNLDEAKSQNLDDYPSFNAFFTRPLKKGARPIEGSQHVLSSPVDGAISQITSINKGQLVQAKGHEYSLSTLLADEGLAKQFDGGHFTTIYLSPRDYHRIHMPISGKLTKMTYIPGKLFSVSPRTVRAVPDLFARNERVVNVFDTEYGPMALVLVGAIFVGSMDTIWHGQLTPPYGKQIQHWTYDETNSVHLDKGEEMGRFNMGSTIILVLPKNAPQFLKKWQTEMPIKLGQALTE